MVTQTSLTELHWQQNKRKGHEFSKGMRAYRRGRQTREGGAECNQDVLNACVKLQRKKLTNKRAMI